MTGGYQLLTSFNLFTSSKSQVSFLQDRFTAQRL
jgi:hypothetical protein